MLFTTCIIPQKNPFESRMDDCQQQAPMLHSTLYCKCWYIYICWKVGTRIQQHWQVWSCPKTLRQSAWLCTKFASWISCPSPPPGAWSNRWWCCTSQTVQSASDGPTSQLQYIVLDSGKQTAHAYVFFWRVTLGICTVDPSGSAAYSLWLSQAW